MKHGKQLAMALGMATVIAAGTAAFAGVTGPQFERGLGKYAATWPNYNMRGLCVCQDGSANHHHVGFVVMGTLSVSGGHRLTASCSLPTLSTADDSIVSTTPCITFVPLAK